MPFARWLKAVKGLTTTSSELAKGYKFTNWFALNILMSQRALNVGNMQGYFNDFASEMSPYYMRNLIIMIKGVLLKLDSLIESDSSIQLRYSGDELIYYLNDFLRNDPTIEDCINPWIELLRLVEEDKI